MSENKELRQKIYNEPPKTLKSNDESDKVKYVNVDLLMQGYPSTLFQKYNLDHNKCDAVLSQISKDESCDPILISINDLKENEIYLDILDGRHRCYAAICYGYQYIPCYLSECDDDSD